VVLPCLKGIISFRVYSKMESSNGITLTTATHYFSFLMIGCRLTGYFRVNPGWTSWPFLMKEQTEAPTRLKKCLMAKNGHFTIMAIISKRGRILLWFIFIV